MKFFIVFLLLATTQLLFANEAAPEAGKEKFIIYEQESPIAARAVVPERPKILTPEPLKKVTESEVILKWNAVQDADAYALQVSDDPNFFKIIVNEGLYTQTEYIFKGFEKSKIYYWRVAALKTGNKTGSMKSLYNRSSFTAL